MNRILKPILFLIFAVSSNAQVNEPCEVCGEGKEVGDEDAVFAFPGFPPVPCDQLQAAGRGGAIPADACPSLPPLVDPFCDCIPTGPAPISPAPISPAPISPPTDPPVDPTSAPVDPTNAPNHFDRILHHPSLTLPPINIQ